MINDIKDGSGERLKQLRKHLNMTQKEFSSKLKLSNGHISDLEKERKNITEPIIRLMVLEFNINETWLRKGIGNMFNVRNQNEELASVIGKVLLRKNSFQQELMRTLAELNDEELDFLENIISKLPIRKKDDTH